MRVNAARLTVARHYVPGPYVVYKERHWSHYLCSVMVQGHTTMVTTIVPTTAIVLIVDDGVWR